MSLDLLDTPLRMTWNLHGPYGPMAAPDAMKVAEEVAAAGVFYVTLLSRPLLHPKLPEIVKTLSAGGSQVFLLAGRPRELSALPPGLPLNTLFLDVQPHLCSGGEDFSSLESAVKTVRSRGYEPALWLVPQRDNLSFLLPLLAFAREYGILKIKLPNTPVDDTVCPSLSLLPTPEDLDRLRSLLGDDPLALHAGMALEVHDLFLWEILFPGRQDGRSEYGGCQAANSLGHIDAFGDVYPCSSWPGSLGSLLTKPLADIWDSSERHRVREEIGSVPAGCTGCRDYALCLGGCRGLGRFNHPEAGGRDPLCREPRGS